MQGLTLSEQNHKFLKNSVFSVGSVGAARNSPFIVKVLNLNSRETSGENLKIRFIGKDRRKTRFH